MFVVAGDVSVLAGKTAKDNHRLTFRYAGPEDFWLHALGVTGAHVVVRNPERARSPDPEVLELAASIAAWFSEARSEQAVVPGTFNLSEGQEKHLLGSGLNHLGQSKT